MAARSGGSQFKSGKKRPGTRFWPKDYARLPLGELSQFGDELESFDRLLDKTITSVIQAPGLHVGKRTDCNDGYLCSQRVFPDGTHDINSIHVRQIDIKEYDVGSVFFCSLYGADASSRK